MKKILIATDGSPPSIEALEFGLDLAAEEEAEAIVVHVVPSIDSVPAGGFGMSHGAIVHEVTDDDRAPLDAAVELAAEKGLAVTTELLRGSTVKEIVAYADAPERRPDRDRLARPRRADDRAARQRLARRPPPLVAARADRPRPHRLEAGEAHARSARRVETATTTRPGRPVRGADPAGAG